ncbi:ephrin-B2a-like [Heterodontus francisci]|uniref:ephrin-B2a-like n=1 Tax=Heterodontus francisci TaxID=7792 RepID=UPI00355C11E2
MFENKSSLIVSSNISKVTFTVHPLLAMSKYSFQLNALLGQGRGSSHSTTEGGTGVTCRPGYSNDFPLPLMFVSFLLTATSEGNEEGLENRHGGACNTRKMKVTLKVGQDPNTPLQPKGPNNKQDQLPSSEKPSLDPHVKVDKENSSVFRTNSSGNEEQEHGPMLPSNIALIAGLAGGVAFLLLITGAIVVVVCYWRRQARLAESHRPTLHLSTLTSPKRGSGGNNNGSEPSDIIIPLRTSDSAFCPHYEKVSGDYGHPVYIVQEMPPQSPANIYYKNFPDLPVAASEKLGKGKFAQEQGE